MGNIIMDNISMGNIIGVRGQHHHGKQDLGQHHHGQHDHGQHHHAQDQHGQQTKEFKQILLCNASAS